jgi:hypothetical protein
VSIRAPAVRLEDNKEAIMAKFLILARGAAMAPDRSPAEMQRIIQKYRDWSEAVGRSGRLLAAEKLRAQEGRVVRSHEGRPVVTDGPYAESKELVGGFWLLEAGAYDDVLSLLREHPHLDGGGALEIRQIEEFGPRG